MRFFDFDTPLSQDEIYSRLERCIEIEPHSMWAPIDRFHSPRTGLHLYFRKDAVVGYYENGERGRGDVLNIVKNWIRLRIKIKNGQTRVCAATFLSPMMVLIAGLLLLPELCFAIIMRDIAYLGVFVVVGCILSVLMWYALKEQKEIERLLRQLLQK